MSQTPGKVTPPVLSKYAIQVARSLVVSDAGKQAGYWEKPLLGKPRVPGGAYVIGGYSVFIMGCGASGLSTTPIAQEGQAVYLPDAQSLASYFLEWPPNKELLNEHFADSDKYADELFTDKPELREIIGSSRANIEGSGVGRPDENVLNVLWAVVSGGKPFDIQTALEAFTFAFLFGASLPPGEVDRLWGIQVQQTPAPLMERPIAEVRAQTLTEIEAA